MDIFTGEIIAMNFSPSFDPNLFLYGIDEDKWAVKSDPLKPLINKRIWLIFTRINNQTISSFISFRTRYSKNDNESHAKVKLKCTAKYHCWKKGHDEFLKCNKTIMRYLFL